MRKQELSILVILFFISIKFAYGKSRIYVGNLITLENNIFKTSLLVHGDDLATYTFVKNNNKIHITANLNPSDIEKAIGVDIVSMTQKQVYEYFLKHMEYVINDTKTSFAIKSIKKVDHHLEVNISLTKEFESITTLKIKNTSLFEVNSSQSNIIQLRFEGLKSDYLINSNMPILTINL
jgi:hypothetical protein